uniref:Chorion peroxidase n=1 Tax=Cacopsylla melanoneura TaxID=428564 RepID=A0A8D8VUF2_9HEMI
MVSGPFCKPFLVIASIACFLLLIVDCQNDRQSSARQFFQQSFANPFQQFQQFVAQQPQFSSQVKLSVDALPEVTFEQQFGVDPQQPQQFLENRLDNRPVQVAQPTFERQVAAVPQQGPRQNNQLAAPCATRSGEAGRCSPLVKCISFYAELQELQSQPCNLNANEKGVCCPLRRQATGAEDGKSGILRPPPPPDVPIPPLTPQQLNQAAMVAIQRIQDRLNLQENLLLNRIILNPDTPAARHQEFFPTTNATLQTGEKAQKSIEASLGLVNDFNLTPEQGTFALPKFSILNTVLADTCPKITTCVPFKYRTPDGSCNNLENMAWGKAGTAYQRLLPPKYEDGVNVAKFRSVTGSPLPSARAISTGFAQDFDVPSENYTVFVMQWGQFLDHDLTHTPISRGQGGQGISCCRNGKILEPENLHPDCFPINLPRNDHIFGRFGDSCMEFVRSLPAPRPECNFGPREQLNQITGYLDGSNVYGSSQDSQDFLRLFKGGWLRAQNVRGKMYLPANSAECTDQASQASCFSAGDGRVNEQIELAAIHMLWLREHNRIATVLAQLNPDWSDEALFQETRRIVIAELQHITYNEFLPIILGRTYTDKFELTPKESGYTRLNDPDLNAGITNVFASAAYRFGHSLIQGNIHGYGKFGNIRENMVMSKQHFKPFTLYKQTAFDDFMRGLSGQPVQKADRFFTREITDRLFQGEGSTGFDLVAFNIQRGRDHGLPGRT